MREITVDLFAGGGGASVGIERAIGRPADVAINRLDGMNKTQQVRLCGNSVPPQFSETLVKANYQIEDQREDKSSLPLFRGTAAKKVERVSA